MAPTTSAAFTSQPTEETPGPTCSTRGRPSGSPTWPWRAAAPNILFAGTWNAHRPPWSTYAPLQGPGGGLYRSTDSGATWTQLTGHGLPEGDWGRVGVAVAPDGKRVYALLDAGKKSGLYRSDDGGDTWTLANSDPRLTSRAWYFNWITVDPSNPDVIYIPECRALSLRRWRQDHFYRARRAGRRRLPSTLDRSQELFAHDCRRRPGNIHQPQRRQDVVLVVQPADRAVLSRDHRQRISLPRLRRAAGQRQRGGGEPNRSWTDHGARLVHGRRRRKRMARARSQRSQHSLRHRCLWQRGPLGPSNVVEPGHHPVAVFKFRQRDQRAQVPRSVDADAHLLAG